MCGLGVLTVCAEEGIVRQTRVISFWRFYETYLFGVNVDVVSWNFLLDIPTVTVGISKLASNWIIPVFVLVLVMVVMAWNNGFVLKRKLRVDNFGDSDVDLVDRK